MAVLLPVAYNLHLGRTNLNAFFRSSIGSPTSLTEKAAGNLPITDGANQVVSRNVVGVVDGVVFDLPTTYDLTSLTAPKVIVGAWQFNAPNRIQVDTLANGGVTLRLYSGSGTSNYREWVIAGNDTAGANAQGGALDFLLDLQAPDFTEVGTFDETDVQAYGFSIRHLKLSGNSTTQVFFARTYVMDASVGLDHPVFTGTSSFDELVTAVQGADYTTKIHVFARAAGDTYSIEAPIQFGDGTSVTNFSTIGETILSPAHNSLSDPRFQLSDQAMRVSADLVAGSSLILDSTFIWGVKSDFDFGASVGASVGLSGNFSGMGDILLNADCTATGSFNNVGIVAAQSANISGIIVNSSSGIEVNLATLGAGTLNNCSEGLVITQAGVYDISEWEFVSNTFDVTVLDGVGAVTLITGGQAVNVDEGTGNTIVIDNSIDVDITAPNLPDGARYQVYNVTKDLSIENDIVSGGSGSVTSVDLNGALVDDGDTVRLSAIHVTGTTSTLCATATAIVTSVGATFSTTLEADSVFNANGIDGTTATEFTADFPSIQIDIDDPDGQTSVQRLYAWFIQELMTADGIANWCGGITAEDSRNYRIVTSVLDLKLQNQGSNSVVLDGARLFRDDGETIFDVGVSPIQHDPSKAFVASSEEIGQAVWGSDVTQNNEDGTRGKQAKITFALSAG